MQIYYPDSTAMKVLRVDIPLSGIKAICKRACAVETPNNAVRLVDQLGAPPSAIPKVYACPVALSASPIDQLGPDCSKVGFGHWSN